MDDGSSKENRLYKRYNNAQMHEAIITINHLNSPIKK